MVCSFIAFLFISSLITDAVALLRICFDSIPGEYQSPEQDAELSELQDAGHNR